MKLIEGEMLVPKLVEFLLESGLSFALFAGGVSAVGWLLMKIIRRAEMRMDWQNQQQKALANFYVDVKIRQYNLETAFGEKNRQKFRT